MSHLTLTEASQGGAAGETAAPPLNWQQSSAEKAVSQLTEKEERIVMATIHFLRTESDICSLLHLAVSTVKPRNKISSLRGRKRIFMKP